MYVVVYNGVWIILVYSISVLAAWLMTKAKALLQNEGIYMVEEEYGSAKGWNASLVHYKGRGSCSAITRVK